jgi:hypothetical protein
MGFEAWMVGKTGNAWDLKIDVPGERPKIYA